ncbi:DUF788-domain-containing protein [Dentipellis sp. KUC8613]|nr:DUF788-domain-containing protein [Dentipellis sp. KUC8613]
MANASSKRIASQNEAATKNLLYGQAISNLLALVVRLLFKRSNLFSAKIIFFYGVSLAISQFLYQRLVRMGTPKRDSAGALISPGDDLNQPGVTEWLFDILYIAWACQLGSALLGEWVWWLYISIPTFVLYKLWTSIISPMFLGRSSAPSADDAAAPQENVSKRQEKLRKRNERGDPRVKAQASRR